MPTQVNFRCRDDELSRWKFHAKKQSLPLASWIKERLNETGGDLGTPSRRSPRPGPKPPQLTENRIPDDNLELP